MSKDAEDFYRWLLIESDMDAQLAKRRFNVMRMLNDFADRKTYGFGNLITAQPDDIDRYIDLFRTDENLRKQNIEKNSEYTDVLKLLKRFRKLYKDDIDHTKYNDVRPDVPIKPRRKKRPSSKDIPVILPNDSPAKTPQEKLARRIEREFKRCTYIGDIHISDEEYGLLLGMLRDDYKQICTSPLHKIISARMAVGLVQIGIRCYDGRYWTHVKEELSSSGIPVTHQHEGWIGRSFYATLIHYGKFHVDENEFKNNILMHCFITKYYANDLFDFLFAYYQIDLDRDLSRNNTEMRNYLMQSMAKGENSARSCMIRKHTADAVSANERGCKIRVGKILHFIDDALFYDLYPENSQNRVAQLFCEWAKNSDRFECARKTSAGLNRKSEKHFSSPYIHFDTKSEHFYLILPQQYIHLNAEEAIPCVFWQVKIGEDVYKVDTISENCVTGCKTEKISEFVVPPENLLDEIRIELLNDKKERINRFVIKSDSIRFFDSDWDMIDSVAYEKYMPEGQLFAFTESGDILQSNSDAIVSYQISFGYGLYTLDVHKGDVLRLPDGKAKSVGKPLEEGLLQQYLVSGAYVIENEVKYSIYSSIPSIYFRMKPLQENGTLILVNGEKHRFDVEKCVRFDLDEETEEKGYILKLSEYITEDGLCEILIDIPSSRKRREYRFALIRNFEFKYDNAPYIFQREGIIAFNPNLKISSRSSTDPIIDNRFPFVIEPDKDHLSFIVVAPRKKLDVRVYLPIFKWKFDNGDWRVDRPGEVWHKEFPEKISIKYPDDQITFFMTPVIMESSDIDSDSENEPFSVAFLKNKEKHLFECDTRRMLSWFGREEAKRILYIETNDKRFSFATVVTRCAVNSVKIVDDRKSGKLIFKSDISGYSDCVADILYGQELLAEKAAVTTSGIRLNVPLRSGVYKIIYYEEDEDEDDDFGLGDYQKFDEKEVSYHNRFDLAGKNVIINDIAKYKADSSIFANHYEIRGLLQIDNIINDDSDPELNFGDLRINDDTYRVSISVLDDAQTKAVIKYYSEEDDDYFDFLYDKRLKTLVVSEIDNDKARYDLLDSEEFYYVIKVR